MKWSSDEKELVEEFAGQNHHLVLYTHSDHPFGCGLVHLFFLPKGARRSGYQAVPVYNPTEGTHVLRFIPQPDQPHYCPDIPGH